MTRTRTYPAGARLRGPAFLLSRHRKNASVSYAVENPAASLDHVFSARILELEYSRVNIIVVP